MHLKADKEMKDQNELVCESTGKATFGIVTYDDSHRLHVCWNTTTNLRLMHMPNALLHLCVKPMAIQYDSALNMFAMKNIPIVVIHVINQEVQCMIG